MFKYRLTCGVVQAYVVGFTSVPYLEFFGAAQYESDKPILTDRLREWAEPIIADLNSGAITEEEGRNRLGRLF